MISTISMAPTVYLVSNSSHSHAIIGYQRSPKSFTIMGSNDGRTNAKWTSLLHVGNSGFSQNPQFKSWVIPTHTQRQFLCYGIRIESIMSQVEGADLKDHPVVSRMMMWERVKYF